jgi:hypothetical protein
MKKFLLAFIAIIALCSHDLFLKLDSYFLTPNSKAVIQLFNGSFTESENVIDRNRMIDASLVYEGTRKAVDSNQWFDRDQTTFLNFSTESAGTYVLGVSTAPRTIEMEASRFNNYLEHDGVVDMLLSRKQNNQLDQDANEKYAKHVKTIFQVGNSTSEDWNTNLGYPIEFMPLENPYKTHAGHSISFQLLSQGKPLANQLVLAGSQTKESTQNKEHTHENGETHTHEDEKKDSSPGHTHENQVEIRTDEFGVLSLDLPHEGVYHLRTIEMIEVADSEITHESNWATITFAVGSGADHSHSTTSDNSHDADDHDHETEFPTTIFWSVSLVVFLGLFIYFQKKK